MLSKCVASDTPALPAEELISRLKEADTLRKIYSLPFPAVAPILADNEFINTFRNDGDIDLVENHVYCDEKGNFIWDNNNHTQPLIRETFKSVADFDQSRGCMQARRMRFDIRGGNYNPRNPSIRMPHMDGQRYPSMRVYFYPSANPTMVTPHDRVLALLERHDPSLLDRKFDSPDFYRDLSECQFRLTDDFFRASLPIPAKRLSVITGVTPHYMPPSTTTGRRFLRAHIFE